MKRIKPLRYRPPGAERSGAELGGSVLVGLGMEEVWWWRRFGGGECLVEEGSQTMLQRHQVVQNR